VVHEGKEIEVVSFDKSQGAIFFILHEQQAAKPRFERAELDCTQCHIAAGTRGVPGVLLRSVQARRYRDARAGRESLHQRPGKSARRALGGWYATGALAAKTMANLAARSDATAGTATLDKLPETFDPADFLAPISDDVALLVLGHQTQMHNLITLTNYRTRIALHDAEATAGEALPEDLRERFERPPEQLLRYLLFVNEARLPDLDAARVIARIAIRARVRGARAFRFSRPLAAPVRPGDPHLSLPLQLSHLLGCIRRIARTGEELRVPAPARSA
jgi:hypothetical protein